MSSLFDHGLPAVGEFLVRKQRSKNLRQEPQDYSKLQESPRRSDSGSVANLSNPLKQANRRYQVAIRDSNITLFEQDLDLRYTWIENPPRGLPAEALLGKTTGEVFGQKADVRVSMAEEVLETGLMQRAEVELPIQDSMHIFDITLVPIQDLGATVGLIGAAVDVTRRARAEEERRLLSLAIDQSPFAVEITDPHGKIIYANQAFLDSTGYQAHELVGRNPWLSKESKQLDDNNVDLRNILERGETWRGEFCNRNKNGEIYWVDATISPVKDAEGRTTHFIAVKEDITERKRSAEELEATRQQLLQSQKLEAIGRLAGGVAHDFNNLLTVLIGNLALLATPSNPEEKRLLEEMSAACDRAKGVARQLLSFSRKQLLSPKTVNLNLAISNAMKLLARLVGEDVELLVSMEPDPIYIRVDPIQLEQVLLNLVINARDALSANDKRIEIKSASEELKKEFLWAGGALSAGRYGVLEVVDKGCGISEEDLTKIFEPFFTTKPVGTGTGLGLSTVFGIVERSLGGVFVETRVGKGTSFKAFFPAAEASSEEERRPSLQHSRTTRQAKIVVVEDDPSLQRLVKRILTRAKHQVSVFSSAEDALEEIAELKPELLITDVVLTGMSGPQFIDELAKRGLDSGRFILMSGYDYEEMYRSSETTFFLAKPFTPQALLDLVGTCLKGCDDRIA
jgi:PAS domain S-box-containing protein